MDAITKTKSNGRRMFCNSKRASAVFVGLMSFVCVEFFLPSGASAQAVAIKARESSQSLRHDLSSHVVSFAEVRWDAVNAISRDVVVTFQLDAFELHRNRERIQEDAGLSLQLLKANSSRRWRVISATDQTNLGRGRTRATVTAEGSQLGAASFGVTVSMISSNPAALAAGDYVTQLTGVISPL